MKAAFTMIELIFVIVILGILAVVAIPKLSATRDDASISRTAHAIATSATEIASYAVARGTINSDLSMMSNMIDALVESNHATLENNIAHFKMGNETECVTLEVDDGTIDANLTLSLSISGDRLCIKLQEMFDASEYPIPLKGRKVVH